ncbi:PP2C family protein-serine/threonine phosphatase [Streptomyces sp. BB1-1-1]|uniref:PP2C family protein-serine/threonine phosphatase n=1 Tax=Streptomyces sp. BB1-1-1 TaxID=3074430 RepID=UPI0028772A22|nr:PP2C family protein-serine/threonine phosphatase [Streptomyces sp. BB1-1-1]WND39727.1 PP2C family protein-serine/threonine phosphatase [Streptomyces sp. BB1-1-1]
MTVPDIWPIGSSTDAARARTAVARLLSDAGVPLLERLRFVTALTTRLRHCLEERNGDGAYELQLHLHRPAPGTDGQLQLALRRTGQPPQESGWHLTATVHEPGRLGLVGLPCPDRTVLADALIAADEDAGEALRRLDEQHSLVRFHREELHHTNQGVLALHAELDAAALRQRELLDAERQARSQAENARRLLTFLVTASAAVSASLRHDDILRRLSSLLVPDHAAHVDAWLFDEDQKGRGSHRAIPRPAAAVVAARTGRPQLAAARPGELPGIDDLPPSALTPDKTMLSIPLSAPGPEVMGVLTLTAPGPAFDPDTCLMLVELTRRAGVALEHARRYEQHRDTAQTLQRAQLTDLPATPGLSLAARYLPATRALNIGGDWYDAFTQPDGSFLAVIGDVTGHGLDAAVLMGQLRTALRAYAVSGDGPAGILTRMHGMLHHQQPELYATAVLARFRPGEPGITWATAGHPPPLVRLPDGTVRVLDAAPGPMLGVPVPYEYQEHAADLPPGSTLALYTDGLVERRKEDIDAGIGRLAQALKALDAVDLAHDLDAAAEGLLKPLLHGSERDDDVCLLLCHTTVTMP